MKVECNDVMTLIRASLTESFYREKDKVIKDALVRVLGYDFRLLLHKHKLSVNIYPNGEEVYSIDGEALVKFLPMDTAVTDGKIGLTQNYYSFV